MPRHLQFVLFDPVSDTKVTWDMLGEDRFGITLKNAVGKIINEIAVKTNKHPMQVMTEGMERVVIRIEPKTKAQT